MANMMEYIHRGVKTVINMFHMLKDIRENMNR